MRKTALILALASTVASLGVFVCATAQQGDILLLKDKKYSIYTNPLEPFLEKNPGKLPKSDVTSTSNWRGYVATWQVKSDRFVLVDVGILHAITRPGQSGFSTELLSVMSKVFPGQTEVLAEWFTGNVIIPDGKLVSYVHMGYASTYEKYIILRVEKGIVTRVSAVDNTGFVRFRDAQFAAYKKTEEYRKALAESVAEGSKEGSMSVQQNEEFLREFYSERYMSLIFDDQQ
ncbi:MAG TPA: hypothetical protein VGV15_14630 [Terriglobales bacterium]|nr:hypothetical protein [Terriglobales bacterium]